MDDMNTNASGSGRLEERGREGGGGEGSGVESEGLGKSMHVHTALTELCICTRTHASFLSPSESSTKQCACLHGHKDTLYTLHRQFLRENVIFDKKD